MFIAGFITEMVILHKYVFIIIIVSFIGKVVSVYINIIAGTA